MTKEFIQKVRAFMKGEPLMLTEILDWLAVSQPIKYNTNESELKSILKKLQLEIFDLDLPDEITDKLYSNEYRFDKILMSYYDLDNVKDWKFAISSSVDDESKLSYFNYKNAEKYKVKVVYYYPNIKFEIDGLVSNNLRFCSDNRIKAKPTSVLKSIVDFFYWQNNKKQQEIIDYISYYYNCIFETTIKEISGEDIRWAYHQKNYIQPLNSGTLWNSCMRYETCQEYLDIYCDNPDKIRMVVVVNGHNTVLGRCLLWQPEKQSNVFYDRVYGYTSDIEHQILDYCRNQGYLSIKTKDVFVELNHYNYDYLPYLDNMCFFTSKGVQNFEDDSVICKFQTTSGKHFSYNDDFEKINGRYFHREDLTYSNYLEEYILNAEEAYYRPGEVDYFPEDEVCFSDLEHCLIYMNSHYVVYLDYCGEYAFEQNCVNDINGDIRYETHVVYSEHMDGYIVKRDAIDHPELGWITKELFDEITSQEEHEIKS